MSYTHIDIIARFWRMRGYNTLLPLCFDDNGLPTEKFTERKHGITPGEYPPDFKELCMQEASESIATQTEQLEYLGFSYNHKLSYRTIDDHCARITQQNFLQLIKKGLISRSYEPMLYCTSCQTALSQADTVAKEERTKLYYIKFRAATGSEETELIIATTRPEFLPACSAVFCHPDDGRFNKRIDVIRIFNPWNGKEIAFLADREIDPAFGSGLMMCCTFGDQDDIRYYRKHGLPLIEILGEDGKLKEREETGILENKSIGEARKAIIDILNDRGQILKTEWFDHQASTCERCASKIEIIMSWQWKLSILPFKEQIIAEARKIKWYPEYMIRRLENWTSGLRWDWIISRQRYYGIPIPAWQCEKCGKITFPTENELPIDPGKESGRKCCWCGSLDLIPEKDVFDTWMTSSLTPRILHGLYAGSSDGEFISFDLRPQAHEIIRTWAMYTIFKEILSGSGSIPWKTITISGWGLGFSEKGKRNIKASKSAGSGYDPVDICKEHGTDAFRYWAAQARPGKDQHLNERTLMRGKKLVTKIFNATRITLQLREGFKDSLSETRKENPCIMEHMMEMNGHLTAIKDEYCTLMSSFNYTDALKLIEKSFWKKYCSELVETNKKAGRKGELTPATTEQMCEILKEYLKLFAPFMPFITEFCWINTLYTLGSRDDLASIHEVTTS